jgi:hypothetical protein
VETLASMKARVSRWCREAIDDDLAGDAVNDAIEKLWLSICTINLSSFLGGPVQNVTFAAASERADIVSIANPASAPTILTLVEGALLTHTIVAGYTLVTESGSETLLSPTTTQIIPTNQLGKVSAPAFVSGAIGWNLYAGSGVSRLALQNDMPLDFSQPFLEDPSTGVIDLPAKPSPPTANTTADDIFYIKVLEMQNADKTYTRWDGAALEGLLMERASKAIPSSSTYSPYAYDFTNGHTIEIRPAAGASLSPRYFYTKKPRRLRFDNALLPFQQYAGSTECISDYAVGKVKMALEEFEAANGWIASSAQREGAILIAANLQNVNRVQRITPYLT